MKKTAAAILSYLLLIFLLPLCIVFFGGKLSTIDHIPIPDNASLNQPVTPLDYSEKLGQKPYKIKSYVVKEDAVREFELEDYLIGVVAGEMPATFPEEALKAQAVAARTFILSRILNDKGDVADHKSVPICTNPAHCKVWVSKEQAFQNWGKNAEDYWTKISSAVKATEGEIALYDNQPISAVFYSMSSGQTENAKDVWGGDVPYLKSVSSTVDEKAPNFETTVEFPLNEFKSIVLQSNPNAVFGENPQTWIGDMVRSEAGGVLTCVLGGQNFKGTSVRTMFGLRSHNFTIQITEKKVIFTVKGYGHGVGLSQWGSKFLAEEGKNYQDILTYYYTGITLGKI